MGRVEDHGSHPVGHEQRGDMAGGECRRGCVDSFAIARILAAASHRFVFNAGDITLSLRAAEFQLPWVA